MAVLEIQAKRRVLDPETIRAIKLIGYWPTFLMSLSKKARPVGIRKVVSNHSEDDFGKVIKALYDLGFIRCNSPFEAIIPDQKFSKFWSLWFSVLMGSSAISKNTKRFFRKTYRSFFRWASDVLTGERRRLKTEVEILRFSNVLLKEELVGLSEMVKNWSSASKNGLSIDWSSESKMTDDASRYILYYKLEVDHFQKTGKLL